MRVPRAYVNYARDLIYRWWDKPLNDGKAPLFSKEQLRDRIMFAVARHSEADGDPATWTACDHCKNGLWHAPETSAEPSRAELCFQCFGKGRQSPADRRRNWGYQQHKTVDMQA